MYTMITTMSKYIHILIMSGLHMKIFIVLSADVVEFSFFKLY